MTEFPKKTCDLDKLIRNPRMIANAKAGVKTQQRRNGVYGYPGEQFALEETQFSLTALERRSLGEMTEEDAKSEGYPNLNAYKEIIVKMHPGMNWDPNALVWVHHFKLTT
jgi:hypothetical protein